MAVRRRWTRFLRALGPGVITGASDDDPAGISTYSVAGAVNGYMFLWLLPLSFPLMVAIQDMAARIGAVREEGLGSVIQDTFGRKWFAVTLIALLITNITTIGADLAGVSAALELVTGIDLRWFVAPIALFILFIEIFWSYHTFARYLKYLALVLFSYILASFFAKPDWGVVLMNTFVPHIPWDGRSLAVMVGVLGTTISPYMFFWQASEEVEEIRDGENHSTENTAKSERWRLIDTTIGMFYSNFIAYFIMLTSAATLHKAGIQITTAAEAAQALRPIAGDYAFLLFALGIIGSGLIAIPVLAGATAYPVSEWIGCPEGLGKTVRHARCFYFILAASVVVGMIIALLPINPIDALFYSQVLMGLLTPIIVLMVLLVARNKTIMGVENVNTPFFNIFGWLAVGIMVFADVAMIWTLTTG